MRFSDSSPISFKDELPPRVDVAIVGGGIIGVATGWYLAQAGISVLLCDKGRVAGEQSSRNWGWVRQTGRDAAEFPIMVESIGLWERLAESIGEDVGFRRGGIMFLAENPAEAAGLEDQLALSRANEVDSRMLTGRELESLINCRPGQWQAGLYTPSDGRAEPWLAVPALARAAQRSGVHIRERCAVRGLDRSGGSVSGVVTEHGRVAADTVVCAAGVWSSLLLEREGIHLPQLPVRNTVARTAPCAEVFSGAACGDDLAFRRRQDGGYTLALCDELEHFVGRDSFRFGREFLPALKKSWSHMQVRFGDGLWGRLGKSKWTLNTTSPFEKCRVWDPEPNNASVRRMGDLLAHRLPALAGVEIQESWAGMIDALPDAVPVMDRAEQIPGLVVATGFSGHGFGFGLGAGRIVADLVRGISPRHDLHRFRLSRFSDGSTLELGPWI